MKKTLVSLYIVLAGIPSAWAQATQSFETNSFATLSVSTSATKKLESVVGGFSGANFVGVSKKIRSGFANTSHSPGVVSTLVTSTASAGEGQVQLDWTHTGRDGDIGQASTFEVKVATVPITYSNYPSINSILNVTALTPGATSQRTLSNLPPGQLYYMSIRTKDSSNLYSRISPNSTFYTTAIAPDPISSISVLSSSAGYVAISWAVTGDDGNIGNLNPGYFRIDYSSDPAHSFDNTVYAAQISTTAAIGSQQFYSLSGMLGNATYYATVYIGDEVTLYSGLSQIGEIVTQAYPPSLTSFSGISTGGFTAAFNAGNSAGTEYYVDVSSYSDFSVYLSSGWTSSTSVGFSDLEPNTSYYVRGKARNWSGVETQYSGFGSVYLPKISATYNPAAPQASSSISGSNFTLSWAAVTHDIMADATRIKRYEVYRSTSISGVSSLAASVSSNTLSYTEAIAANYWYFVKAVDINNNYSGNSLWLGNFEDYGRTVSDDNKALAEVPAALNSDLNSGGMILVLENRPELEIGSTISSYRLYMRNTAGSAIYRDLNSEVVLIMPLSKTSGIKIDSLRPSSQSPAEQAAPLYGASVAPLIRPAVSYSQYDYAVYYNNGVEDIKLGGTVNPTDGTVSVNTKKTGTFLVKQVLRAQGFEVTQTVPRKIFTPNGDGVFDDFNIIYENPQGLAIQDGKIYDLSGREIASLSAGTYNSQDSLMWNGRGKDGKTVPSGIYIYQFKAGDKYYNGTVVVAR